MLFLQAAALLLMLSLLVSAVAAIGTGIGVSNKKNNERMLRLQCKYDTAVLGA